MMNLRGVLARKLVLLISGLVAMGIATAILFAPNGFYAAYEIELAGNTNLINELKAPAGMLFAAALLMLAGVFRTQLISLSLAVSAAVYLPYGLARLLSIALDGVPHNSLVGAAIFEIAVGTVCLLALIPGREGRIAHMTS
tara:strand:+ start:26321 stop:26743 length:423 start_codon:yes stop_codon:yes gene_type:complete